MDGRLTHVIISLSISSSIPLPRTQMIDGMNASDQMKEEGRDGQTESSFANARGWRRKGENMKSVREIHSPDSHGGGGKCPQFHDSWPECAWAFNLPKRACITVQQRLKYKGQSLPADTVTRHRTTVQCTLKTNITEGLLCIRKDIAFGVLFKSTKGVKCNSLYSICTDIADGASSFGYLFTQSGPPAL